MSWDVLDFLVGAGLMIGTFLLYRLATRSAPSSTYRYGVGFALLSAFGLVWVNAAVGIIGNEENDANMMFFGVLLVAMTGAVIARLRPMGMARALYATAGAQVLVAVIALIGGFGVQGPGWPGDFLIMTAFFTALWLISATLFRRVAQEE